MWAIFDSHTVFIWSEKISTKFRPILWQFRVSSFAVKQTEFVTHQLTVPYSGKDRLCYSACVPHTSMDQCCSKFQLMLFPDFLVLLLSAIKINVGGGGERRSQHLKSCHFLKTKCLFLSYIMPNFI